MPWMLALILILPWAASLISFVLPARLTKRTRIAGVATCTAVGATLVLVIVAPASSFSLPWIQNGPSFSLALDALARPFAITVLSVTLLASLYGLGYLQSFPRGHVAYALMAAFCGSMVGTVLAHDALVFFLFWELMLVASSLLLLWWGSGEQVGRITFKYVLYTQLGSLTVLGVLAYMAVHSGTTDMTGQAMAAGIPATALTWLAGLLVLGFGVKLAVFPLHTWLPDAHSIAPMPVTVMLAGAMLSMGAYGMMRFAVGILGVAALQPLQVPLMIAGLVSQIYGALMAISSHDIKRIVAYSSVSQMGYVLFAIGTLSEAGLTGAVMQVVTHGLIKAALFMAVGWIMLATSRRNIERIRGLARVLPGAGLWLALGAMAIAGLPPFAAFYGELQIILAGFAAPHSLLAVLELLAPLATAMYAVWLVVRVNSGQAPLDMAVQQVPAAMRWSTAAAVLLVLILGLFPGLLYGWGSAAAGLLIPGGA